MTGPAQSESEPAVASEAARSVKQRRMLLGAVAGAATLVGIGLAWRRNSTRATSGAKPALWDLSFDAPGKPALHMRSFAGKPLLLNFWATWCAPCIEEFPLLDRFYGENAHNGWQVLGLAVDQLAAVEAFLRHAPVRFPVAMAGMAGIELSRTLGNLAGGLPFTVVLGSTGHALHRKMGRVSPNDLLQWSALR